jgi:hypothetical protein
LCRPGGLITENIFAHARADEIDQDDHHGCDPQRRRIELIGVLPDRLDNKETDPTAGDKTDHSRRAHVNIPA